MAIEAKECTALIGGGANALDAIAYATLNNADIAFVTLSNRFYVFRWNSSSSTVENTSTHPYTIEADDDGGGNGRWQEYTSIVDQSNIVMAEDGWIGIGSGSERIVFDGTGGLVKVMAAGLYVSDSATTYAIDGEFSRAGSQYGRVLHTGNQNVGYVLQRNQSGGSYNVQWLYYIPSNQTRMQWYTDLGAGIAMYLTADTGNLYIVGDCSALTFTDRTPMFAGDAVEALRDIKTKGAIKNEWGELDHDTLPEGVVVEKNLEDAKGETILDAKGKPVTVKRRNLSNMVSLQTKAIQELASRIEALEAK